ncbi:LLM class flavin-dependent oxidoreductase [Bhargavaea ullalensis]|uniref:Luciferase family oxidoreductase group 1 n=1 Tax=Bhargavaea ullalensis TaxID=1265685 RepID=A0ABV2G824_9BACL
MKVSMLDQTQLMEGMTPEDGFARTVEIARHADRTGLERYWVSEHHGSGTLAGSAPEILAAHLLGKTERIRIGTGGVMLTHYSPFKVAESFRVMGALAPGRVDLGIGKAPGGTHLPTILLAGGRSLDDWGPKKTDRFPEMTGELLEYLADDLPEDHPFSGHFRVSPAVREAPDVWILGTGPSSARLAAELGLPYAFAHFINSDEEEMAETAGLYADRFRAAGHAGTPRVIVAMRAFVAETGDEAEFIAGSALHGQFWAHRGRQVKLPPPRQALGDVKTEKERDEIETVRRSWLIGSAGHVRDRLAGLARRVPFGEVMAVSPIFDLESQKRSMELLKDAAEGI